MKLLQPAEPLYKQELRFLRYAEEGLSAYYSFRSEAIKLHDCDSIPASIISKLASHQSVKRLPRLPSNNIMMIVLVILDVAFEDRNNQNTLNKIKSWAYSENITIVDLIEASERSKYSERVMKKLFVQFFHLVASNNYKNKVEKLMYNYPVMQCAFILLCRKILILKQVSNAENLQLPVPTLWVIQTLCKLFEIDYTVFNHGTYQISGRLLVQDSSFVYKVCQKQTLSTEFDESTLFKFLDDTGDEETIDQNVVILSQSKIIYSRPESVSKVFTNKTQSTRPESFSLFPRKNIEIFSGLKKSQSTTPLTFGKLNKVTAKTPEISSSKYPASQSSHQYTIPQKSLSHQRSNSGTNILNAENKGYSTLQPIQRQKSYQGLPFCKPHSLSPEKRTKPIQYQPEIVPRPGSPLTYFNQPLLSKDYNFMDRRWNFNRIESVDTYRYDNKNYQYGY